jgi:ubiquinone/menaquinone biosynthesis C-methylase UbiE
MSQDNLPKETDSFSAFFRAQAKSLTIQRIFRTANGLTALPDEIVPYSFVTLSDLEKIRASLNVTPGQSLVDVACGNGSFGLWLAGQTGAHLTGVDPSPTAIELAQAKARRLGLAARACFVIGSFAATGLPDEMFDAAASTDAIWLAADQPAAFGEIARILRRGARLVFTSWEQHIPMPFVKQAIADYRPLLEKAGFAVLAYERLLHSEEVQMKIYEEIRNSQAALLAEMGEAVQGLIKEAYFVPGLVDGVNYISAENGPHILAVAEKQ